MILNYLKLFVLAMIRVPYFVLSMGNTLLLILVFIVYTIFADPILFF
jgi:hypothetical protein